MVLIPEPQLHRQRHTPLAWVPCARQTHGHGCSPEPPSLPCSPWSRWAPSPEGEGWQGLVPAWLRCSPALSSWVEEAVSLCPRTPEPPRQGSPYPLRLDLQTPAPSQPPASPPPPCPSHPFALPSLLHSGNR